MIRQGAKKVLNIDGWGVKDLDVYMHGLHNGMGTSKKQKSGTLIVDYLSSIISMLSMVSTIMSANSSEQALMVRCAAVHSDGDSFSDWPQNM